MLSPSTALFGELLTVFRKMANKQCGCSFKAVSPKEFKVTVYEDFRAVSAFIKTMKSIEKSGRIESGSVQITVTLNTKNEPYTVIKGCNCKFCNIDNYMDRGKIYGGGKTDFKPLMFFSRDKIYTQNQAKRWIPANLKTFAGVPKTVRELIFTFLSRENPLWKDFFSYKQLPPIPLELINNSHNVRELLQKKFKTNLPKSVNKKPLDVVYAACCAIKYVPEEQRNLLFLVQNHDVSITANSKVIAEKYIGKVIYERLKFEKMTVNERNSQYIIDDYIRMAFLCKEKIDLMLGKKGYRRLHDEFTVKQRLSQSKVKLKIPDTQLSKLKLSEDFTRVTTNKDLIAESVRNNHCVWSYVNKINKGKCLIYTLDYNNEHSTIEIGYSRGKYCLKQLRKVNNQCVSEKTQKYVREAVKSANKYL